MPLSNYSLIVGPVHQAYKHLMGRLWASYVRSVGFLWVSHALLACLASLACQPTHVYPPANPPPACLFFCLPNPQGHARCIYSLFTQPFRSFLRIKTSYVARLHSRLSLVKKSRPPTYQDFW